MDARTRHILVLSGPFVFIVGIIGFTIFGEGGARDVWRLEREADVSQQRWAEADVANDRRLFEIQRQKTDHLQVERLAADELGLARPGATLYWFEGDEIVRVR
ncbi:MAG: hypothetical protein H6732_00770 [Alphaproteobacteria bacterium]|nr:hypothetical protein [Alphaproteobacteria bacterium]